MTDILVTQDVTEIVSLPVPAAVVTQDTIEVLSESIAPSVEKSYIFIDDLIVK